MRTEREKFLFPTRNYPYRSQEAAGAAFADPEVSAPLEAGRLYRFVLGLDERPRHMEADELSKALNDPFAEMLLKRGVFPLSLRALLAALDAVDAEPGGLPEQKSFLVADGGQIPWTEETAGVNRFVRFAVARSRDDDAQLLVSASTVLDAESGHFLQLIAWDPVHAAYNFYERRGGTWIWAGNSAHALAPETRGKGPFDSHVNGAPVMKELRAPWNNWHSIAAHIDDAVLAPDDPLRRERLFAERASADEFERRVVRPGIQRWNRARFEKALLGDVFSDVPQFFRQLVETTTVNLVSSPERSGLVQDDTSLVLPTTFFLNTEALLDIVGLDPEIAPISVPGNLYRESLARYEFALTDGSFRLPGDTFFAFLVPEPAFEDVDVLEGLLRRRLVSARFAACLLMVDFPNPVFSTRRSRLSAYAPASAMVATGTGGVASDLEERFVDAVRASAPESGGPEAEFLANWGLPVDTWQATFTARIKAYFVALAAAASTEAGFDGWVRLAESRRRLFRRRPLAEFRLTLPMTNIPEDASALEMHADGTVTGAWSPPQPAFDADPSRRT